MKQIKRQRLHVQARVLIGICSTKRKTVRELQIYVVREREREGVGWEKSWQRFNASTKDLHMANNSLYAPNSNGKHQAKHIS